MGNLEIGSLLVLATGIYGTYLSILVSKELKLKKYDILTPLLITTSILILILFSYGLSNIGTGDKGLIGAFILVFFVVLLVASIVINLFLENKNKKSDFRKHLVIITAILVMLFFWGPIVNNLSYLFENPSICHAQIELKDESIIFLKGQEDRCLNKVGIKTNDIDVCLIIKDKYVDEANSYKNNCLINVATNLKDENICRKIDYLENKNFCLQRIAIETNNPSLCEEIESEFCYYAIGQRYDKSVCELIESDSMKTDCLEDNAKIE